MVRDFSIFLKMLNEAAVTTSSESVPRVNYQTRNEVVTDIRARVALQIEVYLALSLFQRDTFR